MAHDQCERMKSIEEEGLIRVADNRRRIVVGSMARPHSLSGCVAIITHFGEKLAVRSNESRRNRLGTLHSAQPRRWHPGRAGFHALTPAIRPSPG